MFDLLTDLPFIWAGLIAFAVLAYVVFDGFDLGIGILYPFLADEHERDQAMNSVAPVWDGNETWLILGGGGLMAAFPMAYAIVMPALYAPITVMLLGLIFRGVAFEFRWRTVRAKRLWDWSFALGSLMATFAQGVALGALVQGIPVANRAYAGGWWNWLTWFSILTGVALVVGYALLGSTWLILKTSGELQATARRYAWMTGIVTLALIGVVSILTPFLDPIFMQRWFAWPAIFYSAPVPVFVGVAAVALFWGLYKEREAMPFFAAIALFVLSYIGIGISFYPYIVPPSVTIWQAAAPDNSLKFLLVGASVLIPLILGYTVLAYWVFRGKVDPKASYH
jgi:cytochrome bd ubiquinol oxidase subunit II